MFELCYAAVDPDEDPLNYELMGTEADGLFIYEEGDVRLQSALDFEQFGEIYTLRLIADDGRGSRATLGLTIHIRDEAEAPGEPADMAVTASTTMSLTVNWSEAMNAGPPITRYEVQYKKENDAFSNHRDDCGCRSLIAYNKRSGYGGGI